MHESTEQEEKKLALAYEPPRIIMGVVGCTTRMALNTKGPEQSRQFTSTTRLVEDIQLSRAIGICLNRTSFSISDDTAAHIYSPGKKEEVGLRFDRLQELVWR